MEEAGSFENNTCCSCSPCLDANGTLVGMKADCSNLPDGRVVGACESVCPDVGYFPLDLSYGGASSECNAENPMFDGTATLVEDTEDNTDEAASSSTSHYFMLLCYRLQYVLDAIICPPSKLMYAATLISKQKDPK